MAVRIRRIIEALEGRFPLDLQEAWDRSGLALGDPEAEAQVIFLCLDITEATVAEARHLGADLMISHHPLFFKPLSEITPKSPQGRLVRTLIKEDIAVYSLHTNIDNACQGLTEALMAKLGYLPMNPLEEIPGTGRCHDLPERQSLESVVSAIRSKLAIPNLRLVKACDQVQRIALVNGSGMDLWPIAQERGVDLFITGDVKYHEALDAKSAGLSILDLGHFPSEFNVFIEVVQQCLQDLLETGHGLEIIPSSQSQDVFTYISK